MLHRVESARRGRVPGGRHPLDPSARRHCRDARRDPASIPTHCRRRRTAQRHWAAIGQQGMFVAGHSDQRDRLSFAGDFSQTIRSPEAVPEPSRRNGTSLCRASGEFPLGFGRDDIRAGADNLRVIPFRQRGLQPDTPIRERGRPSRALNQLQYIATSYQVTAMAGLIAGRLKRPRTSAILAGASGY